MNKSPFDDDEVFQKQMNAVGEALKRAAQREDEAIFRMLTEAEPETTLPIDTSSPWMQIYTGQTTQPASLPLPQGTCPVVQPAKLDVPREAPVPSALDAWLKGTKEMIALAKESSDV